MHTLARFLLCALALPVSASAQTEAASPKDTRPATAELSYAPLRMPDGRKSAWLQASWLVAVNEDWGLGPSLLGAAKGDFGGLFVFGVTGQRRWRLGSDTHLAASLTLGGGGGVGGSTVRFGSGLMWRPELQLRQHWGAWYLGLGAAHTRFPSGNVRDTGWSLTVGRMDDFRAFAPSDAGRFGRGFARGGVGFDEIALTGGVMQPRAGSRKRSGAALDARLGRAGAEARQYFERDRWWGVEGAGAAKGGIDGYMEALVVLGRDWPLGHPNLRLGLQGAVGLGGGGDIDTGAGWLLRAGPTLRWITPWGPSLRLDWQRTHAPGGRFDVNEARVALVLPLEGRRGQDASGQEQEEGTVRVQTLQAGVQQFSRVSFKDGRREPLTQMSLGLTRELSPWLYGTAQANAAAGGSAGAYAVGLFGVGVQSPRWRGHWRIGTEGLVGAAGGGGVQVGGGAVGQWEAWLQFEGSGARERLRLRLGAGQLGTLRGGGQRASFVGLSLGYAYGVLGS